MKKIIVKKESLLNIHKAQKFLNAVQISRILSSIRYNQIIYYTLDKEDNIRTNIKLHNFFNHAALLCEGARKLKELEPNLKQLDSYQRNLEKVEKIFSELKDKRSFLRNVCCRVRNKIVFHFDRCITYEMLEKIVNEFIKNKKDLVFASGTTELVKDMTFDLADNIDFNYILKFVSDTAKSDKEKFTTMIKELNKLSALFTGILEDMLSELIQDYCKLK